MPDRVYLEYRKPRCFKCNKPVKMFYEKIEDYNLTNRKFIACCHGEKTEVVFTRKEMANKGIGEWIEKMTVFDPMH